MSETETGLAVVTGGASGIGLALCHALGQRGLEVLVADRDDVALASAVDSLGEAGITATSHRVDLRDAGEVRELAQVAQAQGSIRYVCLNAGVSTAGTPVWETPEAQFDFAFDVNFGGLLHCIRSFVPLLLEQRGPSAVAITASMAGLVTTPTSGAYSASKAAAIALAKSLRKDLQPVRSDIGVALLCPGMVQTNLQRTSGAAQPPGGLSDEQAEQIHEALNRLGISPRAVAGWVLDALDHGRFWVLPPADDMFSKMLLTELSPFLDGTAFAAPA